jgi:hypothetical protein
VCRVGGALARVLLQSHQSEKTWWWCHSGNTSAGTGSVHQQLWLACCYGSQASHWKMLEEGAPTLTGSCLS